MLECFTRPVASEVLTVRIYGRVRVRVVVGGPGGRVRV